MKETKMSVITVIQEIKAIHPEYVALVKIGSFYNVYMKEAYNSNNLYNVNPNNRNVNNNNNNGFGVRVLASINCGYIINGYIRDNIETNHVH